MPLYEYSCEVCGEDFEKMVRFSDANSLPECPKCQSKQTRKKVSLFSSAGSATISSGSSCSGSGRFT